MSYRLEKYPDEPILVMTLPADYDVQTEVVNLIRDVELIFNALTEPVFFIVDVRESKLSLQDLIIGLNTQAKESQRFNSLIRENITVTQNKAMSTVVKGLDTEPFGNVKISIFPTVEDAVVYARSQR